MGAVSKLVLCIFILENCYFLSLSAPICGANDCNFTTVKVTGLPPDIDKDILEIYFESKKRSDGGGVKNVSLDEHHSVAMVTFTDPAGKNY